MQYDKNNNKKTIIKKKLLFYNPEKEGTVDQLSVLSVFHLDTN